MSEVKYLDKTGLGTVWGKVKALVSPKADKSEMSVTPGTGTDADKTTIQLKQGTSATVLTQHQDISGKADKDADAVEGNLAEYDANGNPVDSGIATVNIAQKDGSYDQMQVGVAKDLASSQSVPAEIVFRNTGGSTSVGKGGTAIIDRIKGKTLVWNQLNNIETYYTVDGLTIAMSGRTLTVTGTAGSVSSVTLPSKAFTHGHKYIVKLQNDLPDGIAVGFYDSIYGRPQRTSSIYDVLENYEYFYLNLYADTLTIGQQYNVSEQVDIIDLTLMFGAGNEPSTVAEFEALYPGNHDHDEGTLISNDASAIETVGFNLWDEEWELGALIDGEEAADNTRIRSKGFTQCLPNTEYNISSPPGRVIYICYYDSNKNYISYSAKWVGSSLQFTTPVGAHYIRITGDSDYGPTYNHDICINLSDPSRNGTYEPYWKSQVQLNLDDFYVKDPSGGADIHITGGLKSAGTVYDEIVGNKYIQRVGEVDLGSLNWFYQDGVFWTRVSNIKGNGYDTNMLCSKYAVAKNSVEFAQDKTVSGIQMFYGDNIIIRDSAYSDAASFKTAMSGVMLYYELAEPIEYELVEALPTEYRVDSHGTERRLPEDTASSVHAPFAADITYSTNIKETVENLPKNYINVDSMHAFLAALGTAMNGEWDMRQGNGRFIFTFTPNTNENE